MVAKEFQISQILLLACLLWLVTGITSAQTGVYVTIRNNSELGLYKLPDSLSPITHWLTPESIVLVSGRNIQGSWYFVRVDSMIEGWLPFETLVATQDIFSLPIIHMDSDTLLNEMPFLEFRYFYAQHIRTGTVKW